MSRRGGRRGLRATDVLLAVAILGLLALLAGRAERVAPQRLEGPARIHDGDTLTIAGERVRLRGLDAPELDQSCGTTPYPCGKAARQALQQLVDGRAVRCEGTRRDRYGRLLVDCAAGPTRLNTALVEAGWAVAFGDFEAEEREARTARRGLWADAFDRPKAWREMRGSLVEDEHRGFGFWLDLLIDGTGLRWMFTKGEPKESGRDTHEAL